MRWGEAPRQAGLLGAAVALGGVLLATVVSPSFRWTESALSNLGTATTDAGTPLTAVLFNGGLIAGGLAGLVFAAWCWRTGGGPEARVVVVLLALALLALVGIGLFPQGRPLHLPVAAAFYVFVTALLWTDGTVALWKGRRQRGVVSAGLGTATATAWVTWELTGPMFRPGLALPEVVGAVAFAAWVADVSHTA